MKIALFLNEDKKFIRNLFYINDINDINISYIIPRYDFLNNKNLNIIEYDPINKYKIFNNFDIIIFLDNYIFQTYKEFDIHLLKPKLFYLTHGIHLIYDIEEYKKKYNTNIFEKWIDIHKHLKLNYITCCNYLHKNLIYEGIKPKYIHKINSLPQFQEDILLFKSNNVELYKDCIIIFICQEEIVKYTKKKLSKIIQLIRKYYTKNKIYFKVKKEYKRDRFDFLYKFGIDILNETTNIFNFKKAKLIIILEGGTSFLECLQFNQNVLLLKLSKSEKYYTFYPDDNRFKELFICNNLNHFDILLRKIKTYIYDDKYKEAIQNINLFHCSNKIINRFNIDFLYLLNIMNIDIENQINNIYKQIKELETENNIDKQIKELETKNNILINKIKEVETKNNIDKQIKELETENNNILINKIKELETKNNNILINKIKELETKNNIEKQIKELETENNNILINKIKELEIENNNILINKIKKKSIINLFLKMLEKNKFNKDEFSVDMIYIIDNIIHMNKYDNNIDNNIDKKNIEINNIINQDKTILKLMNIVKYKLYFNKIENNNLNLKIKNIDNELIEKQNIIELLKKLKDKKEYSINQQNIKNINTRLQNIENEKRNESFIDKNIKKIKLIEKESINQKKFEQIIQEIKYLRKNNKKLRNIYKEKKLKSKIKNNIIDIKFNKLKNMNNS